MNIYTTGIIGYETARRLYEENKALFEARFPKFFLQEFEKLSEENADPAIFLDNFCIEKNTKNFYSRKNFYFDGSVYCREIKEGGIFAALWAACDDLEEIFLEQKERRSVGLEVKLEEIPLDQHVVEIMELLKESPYEESSAGSFLVIPFAEGCEESELTDSQNDKVGEPASFRNDKGQGVADSDVFETDKDSGETKAAEKLTKIGVITDRKARVIISGESQRFLTPPARQAQDISDRNSYRPDKAGLTE